MRYYAIFLYTNNKQDYIMPFKPFENRLSHGVIVNLLKMAAPTAFLRKQDAGVFAALREGIHTFAR